MHFEICKHYIQVPQACMSSLPVPKRQILDSSKLKELADDNFKFDENGKKVLQTGRKHCGKRRNCSLRAISPFPTVFCKKACTADT